MTTDDDRGKASRPLSREQMGALVYSVRLALPDSPPPEDSFPWPSTVPNPPPWRELEKGHWRLADRGLTIDVVERGDGDCMVTGLPGKPQPTRITGLRLSRLVAEQSIYRKPAVMEGGPAITEGLDRRAIPTRFRGQTLAAIF